MDASKDKRAVNYLVVTLLSSIFLGEFLIMQLIGKLPEMSHLEQSLLDAALLSLLTYPITFYFAFKPLKNRIADHERTEDELVVLNRTLQEREKELEVKNFELKRTNTALNESMERFTHLFNFSPVGYLILSGDGVILEANDTSQKMLATDRSNLLQRDFTSFIPHEEFNQWYLHAKVTAANEEKQNCKLIMKRNDGSVFYALLNCIRDNPLLSSNIYVTFSDITHENWKSFQ